MITQDRLAQLAPHARSETLAQLAAALATALPQFGVTTALDRAHFIAQACYETQGFTRFEENLNYSTPARIAAMWPRLAGRAADLVQQPQALADAAYAWRLGNGSENSGDGWRFRGRGLFQLTGRDAYASAASVIGNPYVADPDLVAQPGDAVLTAANFWKRNGCGRFSAHDDAEGVTRIINGPARAGLTERRALTEQAKRIFT